MVADEKAIRLAQMALDTAREAKHMAEINNLSTSSYEKVCAERYETINTTLLSIPLLVQSINEIRVKQAEGLALNKALAIVSLAVGILFAIVKVTGVA